MLKFKKILFPVDLSEVSEKIVPYVLEFTKNLNAEVHLLYVVKKIRYFSNIYIDQVSITSTEVAIGEGALKSLQEFREKYFADFPETKVKVITGYPAEEIIKYAEIQRINLIIMGSHGRRGIEKVIIGSVADQVVKTAPVPTTIINPYRVF